jgi:hypothetical protein
LDEEEKIAYKITRVKTKTGRNRIKNQGTEERQQKPLLISWIIIVSQCALWLFLDNKKSFKRRLYELKKHSQTK